MGTDQEFADIMSRVNGHTLVDAIRCRVLYDMALQAPPGWEAAEVGVYKGGTARLLAEVLAPRTIHLFDTFTGMPDTLTAKDRPTDTRGHFAGDFNDAPEAEVRRYLADLPNAVFHVGLFPETAHVIWGHSFGFVHVDCDIYQSVLDCCKFFVPRLVPGGIMVFDDYGFPSCPGAKAAVDEFCAGRQGQALTTGQYLLRCE